MPRKHLIENGLENALFASRWLMAPFYVGLVLSLAFLMIVFFQGLFEQIPLLWTIDAETGHFAMREEEAIMLALSLIDISLAGNLVLIVIFAGYENFVSKMDLANEQDRPEWMGHVDFSGLKLKLVASIVAISRHLPAQEHAESRRARRHRCNIECKDHVAGHRPPPSSSQVSCSL